GPRMTQRPGPARVWAARRDQGGEGEVIERAGSPGPADGAAAACGVAVGQIVKSLVFVAGDEPILVLASGANQVDEGRLAVLTGRVVRRADAALVREATGYAIGGGPPGGPPPPPPRFPPPAPPPPPPPLPPP